MDSKKQKFEKILRKISENSKKRQPLLDKLIEIMNSETSSTIKKVAENDIERNNKK